MAEKKLITVIGATGAQGGGLVRAILADKNSEFSVRAVTRNPNSEKALALKKIGAEVVAGNTDDKATIVNAFKGSYGVFCLTNYWELFSPEKEQQQAKNMAAAAKETGVKHVIWSTLEDTRKWIPLTDDRMPTLMEKYKVPHYDSKGEANAFFTDLGLPVTFLNTSFYWENFIFFGMGPKKEPDGKLAITFPLGDKKLPGIAVDDIGKCALGIFKKGNELINKAVYISGENLTGEQMAAYLSKAIGKEIKYNNVTPDVFRGFGFPGADDVGNMFQFKRDFESYYSGTRKPEFARSLNPDLKSFSQWAEENKSRIPLE